MSRKLFCEISPFTYRLSMEKEILKRKLKDFFRKTVFAHKRTSDSLPVLVYQHKSLIRRRLGNVNMQLQESICSYVHLLRNSRNKGRHVVVLVGEDLGY